MTDTIYPTVTHAFVSELEVIVQTGEQVTSRGFTTREVRPRLVRVAEPCHRVLLVPNRYNNVFATVAETMWVLAGRNDLAFLSTYLPRADAFSDDGIVWRAGYGPRLRDWNGVDQLQTVGQLLSRDPASRQAVIVLFDPSRDNVPSRDIPCNNWLHALVRSGYLELSVAIRSNDIMWGFSGINAFEWSVLQEILAFWTGTLPGTTTYFIDSLHLYERHYSRAQRILAHRLRKTLYDFGFMNPHFSTPFEAFDDAVANWFRCENLFRQSGEPWSDKWNFGADDLLSAFLQLAAIYHLILNGTEPQEIGERLAALPESDLKLGAIEYVMRRFNDHDVVPLTPREQSFFDYYWQKHTDIEVAVRTENT